MPGTTGFFRPLALCSILAVVGCSDIPFDGLENKITKSIFELQADDFTEEKTTEVSSETDACQGGPCLEVEKGDILLFTAEGTLETGLGSLGPAGHSAWGGTSFALVNRPVWGLFGQINDNIFLIGRENVIIAPDTGWLSILINHCTPTTPSDDGCETQGGFQVKVYSHLKPQIEIAKEPLLTDNSIIKSTVATVDAAGDWQDSGVSLKKGQKVFISATGTFSSAAGQFGADGHPGGPIGGTSYALVNRFVYRLYGRVDENVVELGSEAAFLSPAAGKLELLINHASDTQGQLAVTIDEGVVPAKGVGPANTQGFTQQETLSVNPDGSWHATKINVAKGDPMVFTASGTLAGSGVPDGSVDPFGYAGVGGTSYALVNRPVFALFGRVGDQAFFVGGENARLAPASGLLELLINALPGCASCSEQCAPPEQGKEEPTTPPDCVPCSWCEIQGSFTATIVAP